MTCDSNLLGSGHAIVQECPYHGREVDDTEDAGAG